mmetsp:Transcript_76699/g.193620  ORF Transcript_76699/g.193620 Transcript_76699/m.193620 type:complete len:241 (+) Transcript_76699:201-923(+)
MAICFLLVNNIILGLFFARPGCSHRRAFDAFLSHLLHKLCSVQERLVGCSVLDVVCQPVRGCHTFRLHLHLCFFIWHCWVFRRLPQEVQEALTPATLEEFLREPSKSLIGQEGQGIQEGLQEHHPQPVHHIVNARGQEYEHKQPSALPCEVQESCTAKVPSHSVHLTHPVSLHDLVVSVLGDPEHALCQWFQNAPIAREEHLVSKGPCRDQGVQKGSDGQHMHAHPDDVLSVRRRTARCP